MEEKLLLEVLKCDSIALRNHQKSADQDESLKKNENQENVPKYVKHLTQSSNQHRMMKNEPTHLV